MSYLGYVNLMTEYCKMISEYKSNNTVNILEIGVDKGQTLVPLVHNLLYSNVNFLYTGVDILWNKNLAEQLSRMDGVNFDPPAGTSPNVLIFKRNSLDWLPEFSDLYPDVEFDLVLLDGDHNYETVYKELGYISKITHPYSICIADDYNGKWADRDGFYVDSPNHGDIGHKKPKRNQERQGANNAIDDYVSLYKEWNIKNLNATDEPVFLCRENLSLEHKGEAPSGDLMYEIAFNK